MMKSLHNIETLATIWLVLVAVFISATAFIQARAILTPVETITTNDDAFAACVHLSQDYLKIAHRQVESVDVIRTATIPHRGVYFSVVYQADGRAYRCDLARGINGRWFLNSLYTVR